MTCDKCGSRMVGNSTSDKMKGGRKQYYVCGGYLRKGKQYCPYAGWNKQRAEELVANRLRLALMRLIMNDNLTEELRQYFLDNNQHKYAQKKNLENEVDFLLKRIQLIEADIQSGKAKAYHRDMLEEMQNELAGKSTELSHYDLTLKNFDVPEEYLTSTKYDIQAFLSLLDQEVPNVQLLNTIASRFISRLTIDRDTKKLYLTLGLTKGDQILYEKTLVADWV